MSHNIKAGVATGREVQDIFKLAKEKKFALPAVNVIGSNTINGVLETARDLNAPVIIQFSNGGAIFPATAEAATTAGDARYASADGSPILPLKFLFVAEMPISFGPSRPEPKPMHGPHPGGSGVAPALIKSCQSPLASLSA